MAANTSIVWPPRRPSEALGGNAGRALRAEGWFQVRTAWRCLLVALVATALDVVLSLLRGYILRSDLGLLVAMDFAMMALVSMPVLLFLDHGHRLHGSLDLAGKAPRSALLLAAWVPVGLIRIRHLSSTPLTVLPEFLLLMGILVILVLERRRPLLLPGPVSDFALAVVSMAAIWAAVCIPLPGREMLIAPGDGDGPQASVQQPNLLLIVLDTVRADHLGLYGYGLETSPFLDRFAAEATVFEEAVAASSWTLPSHASLFTGLYPQAHATDMVVDGGKGGIDVSKVKRLRDPMRVQPLSPAALTLAELARDSGLETAAICGNVAYLYNIFGLDQGFDSYVDAVGNTDKWLPAGFRLADEIGLWRFWPYQRAVSRNRQADRLGAEVNRLALEWLEPRRHERFFLFLNYMDAHDPYQPVWSYARIFPESRRPGRLDRDAILSGSRKILPAEKIPKVAAYDAEIRYLDDRLEELLGQLKRWDLLDKTLIVIVGDHGESFGEHQNLRHGNGVYETEVRVPLLVRRPGQGVGRRISRPVHHVDVLPTVLRELGLPLPDGLQGSGLFAPERRLPVVSVSTPVPGLSRAYPRYGLSHDALYRGPWKLVAHSDGRAELYRFVDDPGELQDLARENPDLTREILGELQAFKSVVTPRFRRGGEKLDQEAMRRLRALGYLQ